MSWVESSIGRFGARDANSAWDLVTVPSGTRSTEHAPKVAEVPSGATLAEAHVGAGVIVHGSPGEREASRGFATDTVTPKGARVRSPSGIRAHRALDRWRRQLPSREVDGAVGAHLRVCQGARRLREAMVTWAVSVVTPTSREPFQRHHLLRATCGQVWHRTAAREASASGSPRHATTDRQRETPTSG